MTSVPLKVQDECFKKIGNVSIIAVQIDLQRHSWKLIS